MSTTTPRLDAIAGALLIATWTSSLLYMAEVLQALYYFRTFKNDNWKMKSYIAVTLAIDAISAVAGYACVYLYTITHAGDLVYLTKQNLPVPLYAISTTTVAVLVQSFLVYFYWRFTRNTIVCCFLSILILVEFSGGLALGLTSALFPAFKDRSKLRIIAPIWIVTQASSDLIIAGALFLELMKAKSLFNGQRHVNNMLNRLVVSIIRTGTVTAVIVVLALITFLFDDKTNIPVGIVYTSGRVYVISMLTNLNIRPSGRPQNWTTSSDQQGTVRFTDGPTYNFTTVHFYFSESHSNNSGSLQEAHSSNSGRPNSIISLPTVQATASIPEIQSPWNEMVPVNVKQVPEV
ncbi:hypothetical protein C8R45DRAFT_1211970 [Mycena sanguinolenta]|nr:hypothetical protein C8R45DRAFT_1211970 [Mycena sanguinolenta]